MHRFDWVEPRSLEEAHAALREHGDDAKLMAGGTALMLLMRQGLVQPGVIVSLQRVPGLDQIAARDGGIRIGALCTHRRVETHPLVRERFPALHETLERVATIRIRNMGTIGGNLAHSDPAQDPPPTLLALGASVQVAGPDGARSIPLDEFFTDYYENALRPGEVLTAIEVPDQAGSFNGSGPPGRATYRRSASSCRGRWTTTRRWQWRSAWQYRGRRTDLPPLPPLPMREGGQTPARVALPLSAGNGGARTCGSGWGRRGRRRCERGARRRRCAGRR